MASQSLPKTMKGVIIEKTGGTEVLQYKTDLPLPEPKDGQVLIKNDYIGLNYIDTFVPHSVLLITEQELTRLLATSAPVSTLHHICHTCSVARARAQ